MELDPEDATCERDYPLELLDERYDAMQDQAYALFETEDSWEAAQAQFALVQRCDELRGEKSQSAVLGQASCMMHLGTATAALALLDGYVLEFPADCRGLLMRSVVMQAAGKPASLFLHERSTAMKYACKSTHNFP